MLSGELLNRRSKQWYLREIILLLITYTKLGTLFRHFLLLLQVSAHVWGGESVFLLHLKSRKDTLRNLFEIQFAENEAIFTSTLLCTF